MLEDLGYPYHEQDSRTILVELALSQDKIDEVVSLSRQVEYSGQAMRDKAFAALSSAAAELSSDVGVPAWRRNLPSVEDADEEAWETQSDAGQATALDYHSENEGQGPILSEINEPGVSRPRRLYDNLESVLDVFQGAPIARSRSADPNADARATSFGSPGSQHGLYRRSPSSTSARTPVPPTPMTANQVTARGIVGQQLATATRLSSASTAESALAHLDRTRGRGTADLSAYGVIPKIQMGVWGTQHSPR